LQQIPLEERKEVLEHFRIMNDKLRKLEYKGFIFYNTFIWFWSWNMPTYKTRHWVI
jgi:hypothetical protein